MIFWSRAKSRAAKLFGHEGKAAINYLKTLYSQSNYFRLAPANDYLVTAEQAQTQIAGIHVSRIVEAHRMRGPRDTFHRASAVFRFMRKTSVHKIEFKKSDIEAFEEILDQGTLGTSIREAFTVKYRIALHEEGHNLSNDVIEMLTENFMEFLILQAWRKIDKDDDPLLRGIDRSFHDGWPVISIAIGGRPETITVAVKAIPPELRPPQ